MSSKCPTTLPTGMELTDFFLNPTVNLILMVQHLLLSHFFAPHLSFFFTFSPFSTPLFPITKQSFSIPCIISASSRSKLGRTDSDEAMCTSHVSVKRILGISSSLLVSSLFSLLLSRWKNMFNKNSKCQNRQEFHSLIQIKWALPFQAGTKLFGDLSRIRTHNHNFIFIHFVNTDKMG